MRSVSDPAALAETLVQASPDGLLLVGADGTIRLANRSAGELFGIDPAELVGSSIDRLVPEEHRPRHEGLRQRYAHAPSPRPMGGDLRLQAQHSSGSLFPVEISLSPVEIGDETCTIATVRDVSERQDTLARLTRLTERERIARDIHDMVIQRIFAAGMSLQAVAGLTDSMEVRDRLAGVTDDLDETIRQLRRSIFELGQDDLHQTLSSHIAAVVDERERHLGFRPELQIAGTIDDLPDFISDQLIATLTEALSNVARHADATEANVVLRRDGHGVVLEVSDNGVGLGSELKARGGLSNMMWRAAELGGTCAVAPNPPSGTVLTWHVPVDARG